MMMMPSCVKHVDFHRPQWCCDEALKSNLTPKPLFSAENGGEEVFLVCSMIQVLIFDILVQINGLFHIPL